LPFAFAFSTSFARFSNASFSRWALDRNFGFDAASSASLFFLSAAAGAVFGFFGGAAFPQPAFFLFGKVSVSSISAGGGGGGKGNASSDGAGGGGEGGGGGGESAGLLCAIMPSMVVREVLEKQPGDGGRDARLYRRESRDHIILRWWQHDLRIFKDYFLFRLNREGFFRVDIRV
jgi:hypothetical protein